MFNADRPISSRRNDRFRRSAFSDALTAQLLALSKEDSFVIGLTGPWGSGKTSVLRIVEESVHENPDVMILKFNPWLFSGAESLVAHFFKEISAQLAESKDKKLNDIGEKMIGYSEALSPLSAIPLVGEWVERLAGAGKFLGGIFKRKGGAPSGSVTSQRDQIERALLACQRRLWIVVDDIDRLSKVDIRELFKLVRLTADFPGITYILAFDRVRVEDALGESEGEGRAYLAKILQVAFEVPVLRSSDLRAFLLEELSSAVDERKHGPLDQTDWGNIFLLAIAPLFRTPRDVRRYTNAIPVALSVVGEEVALPDLLALEAVRCMLPDTWLLMRRNQDLLTKVAEPHRSRRGDEHERSNFEALLRSSGADRSAVEEMCSRVFPPSRRFIDNQHFGDGMAKRWQRERRLASSDVLRFYFEASFPDGILAPSVVQGLFDNLGNFEVLRDQLLAMGRDEVEHVCGRLEAFEGEFPADAVEPALLAFLQLYPTFREGRQGFFDVGSHFALTRLALRLLKAVPDKVERASIVLRVSHGIGLSARRLLSQLVGWVEGAGHKLVNRATSVQLEVELEAAILAADAQTLSLERDLMGLLRWVDDGEGEVAAHASACAPDDSFMASLLRSGLSETGSRSMGDVAFRTTATLPWSYFRLLFGDELLMRRVIEMHDGRTELSLDARSELALETARKYCEGWRPKDPISERPRADEPLEALRKRAKYDAKLLVEMLQSLVPARRRRAVGRVADMADRGEAVDSEVLVELMKLVRDESIEPSERIRAVELLGERGSDTLFLPSLAELWLKAEALHLDVSLRIASILSGSAPGLKLLLIGMEQVEPAGHDSERVQRAARVVGVRLADKPPWLTHEQAAQVALVLERVGPQGAASAESAEPELDAKADSRAKE